MTTLYNTIKIGDTITMTKSSNLVKSGVVASLRKWNGDAMRVTCTNGAIFELNRREADFSLASEVN
jgi:hypothetical protein